ncbi:hypothetical protein K6119_19165 [Paracrocinitomix mangrovi]|uniref:hypothetical protein n=1 Tax=Paracrocinitomix mangrovi TaxID=2862509 RepID=UPI001C8E1075|nr:hypothetical protein [Paracrocinitomix mangrovi]UKN01846.1 hypothetical protein K6119_19165 [Paracrocinitomix mangrovi]
MKYLVYIGLLAVGIVLGYVLGNQQNNEIAEDTTTTEYITETRTVHDTVVQTNTIKVTEEEEELDSLEEVIDTIKTEVDTTLVVNMVDDTTEDVSISREKMIKKDWLRVNVVEEIADDDSLLNEMMGISKTMPDKLMVEFWESPLHFSGYKLSKSKLILYGMEPGNEYKLYRNRKDYFLSTKTFYYSLKETEQFLPYLEVKKEVVFND